MGPGPGRAKALRRCSQCSQCKPVDGMAEGLVWPHRIRKLARPTRILQTESPSQEFLIEMEGPTHTANCRLLYPCSRGQISHYLRVGESESADVSAGRVAHQDCNGHVWRRDGTEDISVAGRLCSNRGAVLRRGRCQTQCRCQTHRTSGPLTASTGPGVLNAPAGQEHDGEGRFWAYVGRAL